MLPFRQVDVFSAEPWLGNPLAVVHDADGVSDEEMARFARWTNLSETTFLCAPTDPGADYRVRIWTIGGELPFAGHPTIGSAHAWLEAGGVPRGDVVVQECGAGLVDVRRSPRLGFSAPPLRRSGPVDADLRARIVRALGIDDAAVEDMAWIDNGPGWVGVDLGSADAVVAVAPDVPAFTDLKVTVLGRWDPASAAALGADVEVRAFYADGRDFGEDPVTGSANAGLAQWLIGTGALPASYTARQGSVIGREGRVRLEARDGAVWVSGEAVTRIVGEVDVGASGSGA
ncbi:PhzF family phenazine biosynthesis protein [Nocardioides sp. zg-1228]|uniref:PhzF family phenazine biosynthesis protein n=1 Tax=Nocardioides sp. zg-1228 TaxID=2763008 RepID=UPI0016432864|nr:PhzF family phenazine biosynthesis protein [Nocardioides sp. zg-1228]MBC2933641.1 PhzF family phenazine biosynthesis protein [Nocardioides sp. zg-1228]QSF56238.1 PhzF family phenazine biosynthesis protein [Nocardioides sp. zg-1228]